jgi:hypothetical protein
MNEHEFQVFLTVLGGFLAGILGFFGGWLLNGWQNRRSREIEIANRRREFLSFLSKLRIEIHQPHPDFQKFYLVNIAELHRWKGFIIEDVPAEKRAEFVHLVSIASGQGIQENEQQRNISPVIESIDKISSFFEKLGSLGI